MTLPPGPCPYGTHKKWCCPYHDHRGSDYGPDMCRCVPDSVKEPEKFRLPRPRRPSD